jgi:hypothetical protein
MAGVRTIHHDVRVVTTERQSFFFEALVQLSDLPQYLYIQGDQMRRVFFMNE